MSANIRTPSQHCADECSRAFMHGPYSIDYGPGVVRRCEHGRIWKYLSNKASISLWGRVRFQLEPIVYIRAVVALKDIENGVTSGTHN